MILFHNISDIIQESPVKNSKSIIKVVKKNDFFCMNEIKISKLIQTIPDYFLYFQPVIKSKKVKVKMIDYNSFENEEEPILNNDEYMLIIYDKPCIQLNELFSNFKIYDDNNRLPLTKNYVFNVINSFQSLLYRLSLLFSKNIVHGNINHTKITFNNSNSNSNIYYLSDFTNSFLIDEIDENKLMESLIFKKYNPRNIYIPIEIHLICFMNEYNFQSISRDNINQILEDYMYYYNKMSDIVFKNEENIQYLKGFINKPKDVITNHINQTFHTWDNYSLSIIYLQVFSFLEKVLPNSSEFVNKIYKLLINNISIDPNERLSINKTRIIFDNIISSISEKEWNNILSC